MLISGSSAWVVMKAEWSVTIVAALAVMAVLMPFAVADSAAEEGADLSPLISLRSTSSGTSGLTVESGGTATMALYVINLSDTCLLLDPRIEGADGLGASLELKVGDEPTSLLMPGSVSDPSIAVLTLSVSADRYAEDAVLDAIVYVDARDVTVEDPAVYTASLPVVLSIVSVFSTDESYNCFFGVIPNTLGEPFDSVWFTVIATFAMWVLATVIVSELIIPLFTRLVGNRKTAEEKRKIRNRLTETITAIMIVICIGECARIAGAGAELIDIIGRVSRILYIVLGSILAWQMYKFIVTAFLKGLDEASNVDGLDSSLVPLFKMIGRIAISVVACCALLSVFGVDLAGILVSAGVITLGITLGAQNILNQFFSGIVLLATRPFTKGDFVRINGETYIVEKVRIMFTEFKNWDGDQVVTMPNNVVSGATLLNLTKGSPWTRIALFVHVTYDSDIDLCKKCLVEAASKHPHVIIDGSVTPPSPRLNAFDDSGISFKLAVWVDDFDNSSVYAGQIRELIYAELLENGFDVPYSRIELEILDKGSE